jgi:hypothetical protein
LTDSETGAPVEGALILLVDSEGEQVGGYLTNPAGRFLIRAPAFGTFTIRSERIGYETVVSDPFLLDEAKRFDIDLTTSQKAIELEGIRVEGDQRCVVRPQEGERLAAVWDEARKALVGQEWAEREGLFRFRISRYERTLDPNTGVVQDETRRTQTGISGSPIRSLPVDDLMANGFVRRDDDGGYTYFGPDASVMLSDRFLDTHCFRLVVIPEREDEVGLGFEPVRPGGNPDIAGVLWLDVETAELLHLDYLYTWSPWLEMEGVAHGFIDFEQLPSGAWVVPRWWIRMPIVVEETRTRRDGRYTAVHLRSLREVGGEIQEYSPLGSADVARPAPLRGVLRGVAWDSTRQAPLTGATVFLSGTPFSCETDSAGGFLMEGLPGGVFSAVFTHPRLDSLGVFSRSVEVEIKPGESTDADLGIPASAGLAESVCSEAELETGNGALMGFVREVRSGSPVNGVFVRVTWDVFLSVRSNARDEHWLGTYTDAHGRYTICGVPLGTRLSVRAEGNGVESEAVRIRANPDGITWIDLLVEGR